MPSPPPLPKPFTNVWLVSDIIYRALRAARIVKRAQGIPSQSQYQEGLDYLNTLADQWAARRPFMWTTTFTQYTLTPNHQPHRMGPGLVSPDFNVAVRPVRIESANIVLTGNGTPNPAPNPPATPAGAVNTNVDVPLNIRDSAWWANERVKGIATNIPTDLYPEYDWDSLALWLWPIPSYAYGLRLETWVGLTQFTSIQQKFSAPPAYFNAVHLTLAKMLVDGYELPMPESLPELHRDAMKALQSNNEKSPRIQSADWGTQGRPRGDFNYYTGGPSEY